MVFSSFFPNLLWFTLFWQSLVKNRYTKFAGTKFAFTFSFPFFVTFSMSNKTFAFCFCNFPSKSCAVSRWSKCYFLNFLRHFSKVNILIFGGIVKNGRAKKSFCFKLFSFFILAHLSVLKFCSKMDSFIPVFFELKERKQGTTKLGNEKKQHSMIIFYGDCIHIWQV